MEDEQRDEDESEGDEDEEFFSALSRQTDASDTLQEDVFIVSPYIRFHKL